MFAEFQKSIKEKKYFDSLRLCYIAIKNPDEIIDNNKSVFDLCFENANDTIIKKLVNVDLLINSLDCNLTILMKYITERQDDYCEKIISYSDKIDYKIVGKYGTTLQTAIIFCSYQVVDKLLNCKNVNEFIGLKNSLGLTAFDYAIYDSKICNDARKIAVKIFLINYRGKLKLKFVDNILKFFKL